MLASTVRRADRVPRLFLLSPALCGGKRAGLLLNPRSSLPMAEALRAGTLTLGEAFAFLSGLYFRGKLAYATAFGHAPGTRAGGLVITPTRGLQTPETPASVELLQEFASVDVDAKDARYRDPLECGLADLVGRLAPDARVVLLGSIATGKYTDVLTSALAGRLEYPAPFVGRGDMSRGGLLLRAVAAGVELPYAALDATAARHGPRPPKLQKIDRRAERQV